MNTGKLANWLQVIANLGIVIGLVLVLLQMNQNEELQRTEILNQYHDSYSMYEASFAGERLPEIWEKSLLEPENLSLAEMRALESVTFIPLFRWVNLYRQSEAGILETEDWQDEVTNDVGYYFDTPYARAWWEVVGRAMYEQGFLSDPLYQLINENLEDRSGGEGYVQMYQDIQRIISNNIYQRLDLSGNWEIHSSVGGSVPITVNCSLNQEGSILSGTCIPVMENPEPADLSGSVGDESAVWGYEVVFNGNPGTVDFHADTITANGMLGTLNLSGTEAPFSAIKR